MSDSSRFIKSMKKVSETDENKKVDMVVGEVISVSPLKIKLGKLELTETFLVVGAMCQRTVIKIPERVENNHKHTILEHSTQTGGTSEPHVHVISQLLTEEALPDILLWRGLAVGDKVYMIRMSEGQQYFVIQRKEGIT